MASLQVGYAEIVNPISMMKKLMQVSPCGLRQFLCDSQFDEPKSKFRLAVNEIEPETMRIQPIGRDKMGLVYWFQKVGLMKYTGAGAK